MAPREGCEASTGARASGEHPHGARGPLSPRGGAPLPEDVPDFLLFCDPHISPLLHRNPFFLPFWPLPSQPRGLLSFSRDSLL